MRHPPGFDASLTRPAEKLVQRCKQLLDARIGNAIPDRLAFLAEGHDAFLAQPGKVLGESRLAYTYGIDEGPDGSFAVFDQLTQDHQASLVGQRVQNSRNFRGVPLKIGKIFRGVGQFVHLFGCLLFCSNVARAYEIANHGIVVASRNVDLPPATSLSEKVRMHGLIFISMRGTARRPIGLLALLCILGILVSLVQPSFARGFSKAEPAQAAFAQSHSVKGGKPCKRVVPGAVGTLCSVGALIGLEISTSAIVEPSHGKAGILPYADKRLEVQWLAAPQYRPPRIDA